MTKESATYTIGRYEWHKALKDLDLTEDHSERNLGIVMDLCGEEIESAMGEAGIRKLREILKCPDLLSALKLHKPAKGKTVKE